MCEAEVCCDGGDCGSKDQQEHMVDAVRDIEQQGHRAGVRTRSVESVHENRVEVWKSPSVPRRRYSVSRCYDQNYRDMDRPITGTGTCQPDAPIISVSYPDAPGVITRRRTLAADFHVEAHWHERAQLLYASHGVMRISTPQRLWIAPPTRALWIPAQVVHEIRMSSAVDMRSLYLDASLTGNMPAACAVLEVTPLMRELMLRISETASQRQGDRTHETLCAALLLELERLPQSGFDLPLPASQDLRDLCEALLADPTLAATSARAAQRLGVSGRTLYRRFLRETGLSFQRWAEQARLLEAVRRLAEGVAITTVALDLGYQSPSAFSAMFHRHMGVAPRQWR